MYIVSVSMTILILLYLISTLRTFSGELSKPSSSPLYTVPWSIIDLDFFILFCKVNFEDLFHGAEILPPQLRESIKVIRTRESQDAMKTSFTFLFEDGIFEI